MKSRKSIYSYTVKIIDKPILLNGISYTQSANVFLRDKNGNLLEKRRYGVCDIDLLYKSIYKGEDIKVRDCFISNFSINSYKKKYNISESEFVEIQNFDATNSFFESDRVVNFSNVQFVGEYTLFQNAHFGMGSLTFLRAKFQTALVDFSEASFGEGNNSFKYTEFAKGLVTFENASFINGNLSFVNSIFNDGKATFKNVNFGNGDVSFKYASFGNGIVNFEKSFFRGIKADFSKVDFGTGKVNFRKVNFGKAIVSFEETSLADSKIIFRRAEFQTLSFKNSELLNSTLVLDEALFGTGSVSFFGVKADKILLRSSILSSYIDFRVQKVEVIDLSNAIIHNIIDLKKGITNVEIERLYLNGVRNLGKIFIDWEQNNLLKLIGKQRDTTFEQKAEQYRILKEDFHLMGNYENEDKAYIEFKRNELWSRVEATKKDKWYNRVSTYASYGFQTLVFDWMGKYATSPIRVLTSVFTIYGVFSLLYVFLDNLNLGTISCTVENTNILEQLIEAFYFSAITFLTIGYGDCLPTGLFKIIAPLEGWVGVFMMSYFTVAFVRKILR